MNGYEKDNSVGTFGICSGHVMACDETGRVIAVFYRGSDLDDVLEKISPPKDKPMTMDTAVDEAQERIKLKDQISELTCENTMLRQNFVPVGYVLVPKEPTESMLEEGYEQSFNEYSDLRNTVKDIYKAMLKAV